MSKSKTHSKPMSQILDSPLIPFFFFLIWQDNLSGVTFFCFYIIALLQPGN